MGSLSSVWFNFSASVSADTDEYGGLAPCISPPLPSNYTPYQPPIQHPKSHKPPLPAHVIIIISVAVTVFLLLSYYGIIVKLCTSRRRRRAPPTTQSDTTQQEDFDETQDPIHHIWYVRTVGLEQSIINSISVCKYKRGDGLVESTECSVCLNEFKEDESLRLLPKCSHAFHVDCIDTWLNSHTNCPLCRAGIVSSPAISLSVDPISGSSDQTDETQMGNLVVDIGIESNRTDQMFVMNDEGELPGEDGRGAIDNPDGVSSSTLDFGFRVLSDLGGNHQSGERSMDGIQPVRRSISMDFSSASVIRISMDNLPIESEDNKSNLGDFSGRKGMIRKHHGRNQSIYKVMGSGSKGPVCMKRSLSGGGKFFLSRYGRSRSRNSILPL